MSSLRVRLARARVLVALLVVAAALVVIAVGYGASPASAPIPGIIGRFSEAAPPTTAPQPTTAPPPTVAPPRRSAAAAPTQAPQATAAAALAAKPSDAESSASTASENAAPIDRRIIKNAQFTVTVEKIDSAIMHFTGIAADVGGYVVSNRRFSDERQRGATIVLAIPVDRFEESLNRVRQVPLEVIQDFISTSDVTEQYIDLEARLKNLEATALRIRALLERAQTVEEALKINVELSQIESQVEQIKGKLNALNARTTFSTITIDMREPLPTPTPTPTLTPTPTPTPVDWRPDQTLDKALRAQTNLVRLVGDVLIWVAVVLLPYALIIGIPALIIIRVRRKP